MYARHLARLDRILALALEQQRAAGAAFDAVVLFTGRVGRYHADDQAIPFRPTPHLAWWVPIDAPDSFVLVRPGARPRVVRVTPRDYWEDTSPPPPSFWEEEVELRERESLDDAIRAIDAPARTAWIGPSPDVARRCGISDAGAIEPASLLAALDWHRAAKDSHELRLVREAVARAARGHLAARDAFLAGASEVEVHRAYLEGAEHLERELPFESIVAFDEKAAILHYQRKRGRERAPGWLALVDNGAQAGGYAADLTRTWLRPGASRLAEQVLHDLDRLQRDLVGAVAPGVPWPEIHARAHRGVAALLVRAGVLRCGVEEALAKGIARLFMPHGIGHLLGLQVHDVGGHLASPDGGRAPPPPTDPYLRSTRTLEPGHLVTVEPGVYVNDLLLGPLRAGPDAGLVDWAAVDELAPYGGMRIEDDVVCTDVGRDDLSRPLLVGPRGE